MMLDAMAQGRVQGLIGRAPEFYGPPPTKSYTNTLVFDRVKAGKRPRVPVSAHTKRSLIWTPDASRALALLGNTPDAYGQIWHLPIDQDRKTYQELIQIAAQILGRKIGYTVLPKLAFTIGSHFNAEMREVQELLPRYEKDNIFDTSKFADRFPEFRVTTYHEGITSILTS